MARVTIHGAEAVIRGLEALPDRIDKALRAYAYSKERDWLAFLKATIQHVVYDPYQPTHYKRNMNLVHAASSEVRPYRSPGSLGTVVGLFNDTSKIPQTKPKGGSQPIEVPWQIEEGHYPSPWYGYSLPRPAYLMTGDKLRLGIQNEAEAIVVQVIQG